MMITDKKTLIMMIKSIISTRLLYLTFDDFAYCCEQMIDKWTVETDENGSGTVVICLCIEEQSNI